MVDKSTEFARDIVNAFIIDDALNLNYFGETDDLTSVCLDGHWNALRIAKVLTALGYTKYSEYETGDNITV